MSFFIEPSGSVHLFAVNNQLGVSNGIRKFKAPNVHLEETEKENQGAESSPGLYIAVGFV